MTFTRGDTCLFKFKITNTQGQTIKKDDIESLILTCREDSSDVLPILFQKNINDFELKDDYYHCAFRPADTQNLKYKQYYYDIEVTLKNGYRKTLFSSFTLNEECTIHKEA